MDDKQFNLFAQAIQWVKDERDHKNASNLHHHQASWGLGWVKDKIEKCTKGYQRGLNYVEVCPSACCVAGNMVLAAGERFIHPVGVDYCLTDKGEPLRVSVDYCLTDKGEVSAIGVRAAELAGLDDVESERLFAGGNSATQVLSLASDIAARHGYDLELV